MVRSSSGAFRPLAGSATTGARSPKTFPVKVCDGAIWLAERRSRLVSVARSPEFQVHLDGRLGSVPEPAPRVAGSDLAVS